MVKKQVIKFRQKACEKSGIIGEIFEIVKYHKIS